MDSFDEIYNEHEKRVFNIALHYVRNISDAEEITQDVFLKVYKKLHKFNKSAKLTTWIHRITINVSIDFLRKQKANKRAFLVMTDDSVLLANSDFVHPGIQLEESEALIEVMKVINELPSDQKTAVILSKIEGLSQSETAKIMKRSEKSVESLVGRARKKIKEKAQKREG